MNSRHSIPAEYLSLVALAARLGLPRTYLRNLADAGKIPVLNVNGRLRFEEAGVRAALRDLSHNEAEQESP